MAVNGFKIRWLLAYAVIYFVWGGTFLAVRTSVGQVPVFLCAALRFIPAGLLLIGWCAVRQERRPTARQLLSALWVALLIFVGDYGLLYMGQTRVPSGASAVVMATIPVFTVLAEILFLRTQRMTVRLGLALLIGLGGVAVLAHPSATLGGAAIDPLGAAMLVVASLSWSVAAAMTQRLEMPQSKLASSGVQMLIGGVVLLAISAAHGELGGFHPAAVSLSAWLSILYLMLAGSLLAFTCYLWLLDHDSPTRVSTYAYVNPLVAVLLGWLWGGEVLGLRAILGMACVLVSVVTITTGKRADQAKLAELNAAAD